MGLVNEEEGIGFGVSDAGYDLEEKAVPAHFRGFTEVGDKHAQEGIGVEAGDVEEMMPATIPGQVFFEQFQEGGLAHAGISSDEGELALVAEEFQAGQGLFEALVTQ